MVDNQFETLGNLLDIKETDRPGADSLYAVRKVEGVARRLSFILFEEIVESSPAQSRDRPRFESAGPGEEAEGEVLQELPGCPRPRSPGGK